MVHFERLDVRHPPPPSMPTEAARQLMAGGVLDLHLLDVEECPALVAEILALQTARFDPADQSYTELLAAQDEVSLGWGTAEAHGKDIIRLDAFCAPLRAPGERRLFSITPSIRRARSFPRFYHQDSPHRPRAYRQIWDLGLERSGEVLDVHLIPCQRLEDETGAIRAQHAALFQRAEFGDHYGMSDADIDARQRQVREETLPTIGDQHPLRDGHALAWIDRLFYHSTYLRAGRALEDLRPHGRSIVLIREFIGHRRRGLPSDAELARLLGTPVHGA
jgi:hypothetical protein